MAETTRHIKEMFSRYGKEGWVSNELSPTQVVCGFSGETGNFPLLVEIKTGWLLFIVSNYLDLSEITPPLESIYRLLLEVNGHIYGVKLALDDKGKVILVYNLEYDERVEYGQFQTALDLLTYYADNLYPGLTERLFGLGRKEEVKR